MGTISTRTISIQVCPRERGTSNYMGKIRTGTAKTVTSFEKTLKEGVFPSSLFTPFFKEDKEKTEEIKYFQLRLPL